MKRTQILGIALVLLGAAILAYGHFSYRSRDTVLEVGKIKITDERTKTVPVPPLLGWAFIGSGACVLVFSGRTKT